VYRKHTPVVSIPNILLIFIKLIYSHSRILCFGLHFVLHIMKRANYKQ